MKYLSVCSGIEAATVAWHPLGWTPVAFAEVDTFPSAVLAHHYPSTPNWGDLTQFQEWPDADVDVLVGGTPCQSFSVAGLRKGLADPRGNLALTYLALAYRYRPEWVVWENVPGVFSSDDGGAFRSFLSGLAGWDIPIPEGGWQSAGIVNGAPGCYGLAWRVLDAQYAGLAQRRRRVFVVGSLGGWQRAAAVLLERHSLSGDPAPRREARESLTPGVAGCLGGSSQSGGFRTTDLDNSGAFIPSVVGPIAGCSNGGGANRPGRTADDADSLIPVVANPLTARKAKGVNTTCDEGQTMVPVAFNASHFTRGKDGAPQITAPPLSADADKGGDQDTLIFSQVLADPISAHEQSTYTHEGSGNFRTRNVIAFSAKDSGADAGDIAPTLRAGGHSGSHANGGVMPAVAFSGRMRGAEPAVGREERPPHAMTEHTGALDSTKPWNVASGMQVRRLTPRECERLQGFPDDYTLIPYNGKPAKDGPRYKALGNSMAVPVMRWIGEQIAFIDAIGKDGE